MRCIYIFLGSAILCSFLPASAFACVTSGRNDGQNVGYDKIFIDSSTLPPSLRQFVGSAADLWNDADCNKAVPNAHYTYEFPILAPDNSQGAGRTVEIKYFSGFNPGNAAACGNFAGNTISLFEKARVNGVPTLCTSGPVVLDTLAHEFGHLLGLQDQYDTNCNGYIMSQAGFTPSGNYVDRHVRSNECEKVAEVNKTPAEQLAAECAENPSICSPDNQCGYIPEHTWCSPIVLDLARNGFNFSGPNQPVSFDIDADTIREKICWTGSRTDDTFLALDRNGNGQIDDGSELFGDSSRFLNGDRAQNGYQVLFELDLVRGNGNGFLDREDLDFGRLLLWHDWNHDAKSQPGELTPLAATDIYAIAVEYEVSVEQDSHGNRLRYRSTAYRSGTAQVLPGFLPTVDVFFAPGN